MDAILTREGGSSRTEEQLVKVPQPQSSSLPLYYTFYRPPGAIVTKEEMKFKAPTKQRRAEVQQDNFSRHKRGAWWRMRMLPLLNLPLPVVETSSFLALVQRESLSISNRVPRKKLGSLPL